MTEPAAASSVLARRWWLVRAALWTVFALIVAAAVTLHPAIVERFLSSDGQLAPGSRRLLYMMQAGAGIAAALVFFAGRRLRAYSPARERLVLGMVFAVASIAFSVFVCEVGLRAAGGFRPLAADRHFFFQHDELLGWRHRPGAVALFKNAVVRINDAGLRDDELPGERPQEWRLLFLGDSQMFGDGVTAEDTFVDRLQHQHRSLQAINAGVIGYGTDQEVLYFERDGRQYSPNVTVVGLNAYDLRDNISTQVRSGYLKPRFELAGGALRLTDVPVPRGSLIDRAQRDLRTHSYLYGMFDGTLGSRRDRDEDEEDGERRHLSAARVFPPNERMGTALDVTRALLVRLAGRVQAAGGRLAVVFLPYEMDFDGDRSYNQRTEQLMTMLADAAAVGNFVRLDLRPLLGSGHGLYRDTMHFSAEGHRRVAVALDAFLQSHGLVPASDAR
jgi:hypothetical protein